VGAAANLAFDPRRWALSRARDPCLSQVPEPRLTRFWEKHSSVLGDGDVRKQFEDFDATYRLTEESGRAAIPTGFRVRKREAEAVIRCRPPRLLVRLAECSGRAAIPTGFRVHNFNPINRTTWSGSRGVSESNHLCRRVNIAVLIRNEYTEVPKYLMGHGG
jgi:hypothetical protein